MGQGTKIFGKAGPGRSGEPKFLEKWGRCGAGSQNFWKFFKMSITRLEKAGDHLGLLVMDMDSLGWPGMSGNGWGRPGMAVGGAARSNNIPNVKWW